MSTGGAPTILEPGIGSHALRHNGLASHAQEWQRELDRAQARAWFHAAPPASGDAVPGAMETGQSAHAAAARATPQLAQSMGVAQGANRTSRAGAADAQALSAATTTARRGAGADPAVGPGAPSKGNAPAAAPCSMRLPAAAAEGVGETPHATPRRVAARPPAGADVRMHVERDGEGVRVWVGLDGDEAAVAARAATLLLHLRRALQAEGQRLLAFTCNGRPVDEAPSLSTTQEQTTWRSER